MTRTVSFITATDCDHAPDLSPPKWASDLQASGDFFSLVSARVADAAHLSPREFHEESLRVYSSIAQQLREHVTPFAVRFWNHIPNIHEPMDEGRDRYMLFNAARFEAFSRWYGEAESFEQQIATASGVGHRGNDLVVHCLAAKAPGVGIENPRQIPPYKYSKRFGPLPPCFARATLITPPNDEKLILVGGTASIRGEDSVHVGNLTEQTNETLENLRTLIKRIVQRERPGLCALERFVDLRVYHPKLQDRSTLHELIDSAFPNVQKIEYLEADLCRAELLVEIEGVAHF